MKRAFLVALAYAFALMIISGCASTKDMASVQSQMKKSDRALKSEVRNNREAVRKLDGQMKGLRRSVSEVVAENQEVRQQLEQVKAQVEELHNNLMGTETGALITQLEDINRRLKAMETFVTMGPGGDPSKVGIGPVAIKGNPKQDYQEALLAVKQGYFQKAKELFLQFLTQHPHSEYSDNAQYWLAECFYAMKDYERSILEFDEVIKKYPKSPKAPDALIKQGLSFHALGDKRNAKLILNGVIQMYPNTDQAKIAQKKLRAIGR